MKKLIALFLSLVLLCTCVCSVYAEDTEEAVAVTDAAVASVTTEDLANFDIVLDALPEGYTMTTVELDGDLYATFESEDESAPAFMASVAHSEMFDCYTLQLDVLTEDDIANLKAMLGADYNDPIFSYAKTAHGTDVILVEENGADDDCAEYITIYEGYFISILVLKDTDVTADDLAVALKLLSDMWIVPAA